MTKDKTRAARKTSAAVASSKGVWERTEFGRRRISRIPKSVLLLLGFVAVPFLFVYRRSRRRIPV